MPSDETKERIIKVVEFGRLTDRQSVLHYGWIPMIIYIGYTRSSPQPMFIKSVSPFSSTISLIL
ncbi:hypothetical protein J3R82DRAFT_4164 [Butyriboletus roseoflavus]|nr:hypothetical protein J3R82DRAFT_4164 [Butyriboletus roseoflavus]